MANMTQSDIEEVRRMLVAWRRFKRSAVVWAIRMALSLVLVGLGTYFVLADTTQ